MVVIDFHSHILPGIDDGSRNSEVTEAMLQKSAEDGVEIMIATPHFYASRNRIERFLEKREEAYQKLLKVRKETHPKILLGAEVTYFDGMSQAEELSKLTIRGTNVMLLEMPFLTWDDGILEEVRRLIKENGFRIVIAHLERYLKLPGNKKQIKKLLELPVTVQVNGEDLLDWKTRRPLLSMIKKGEAKLLGSDSHGIHRRPPNLGEARLVIEKRCGSECLTQIDNTGMNLIEHAY